MVFWFCLYVAPNVLFLIVIEIGFSVSVWCMYWENVIECKLSRSTVVLISNMAAARHILLRTLPLNRPFTYDKQRIFVDLTILRYLGVCIWNVGI